MLFHKQDLLITVYIYHRHFDKFKFIVVNETLVWRTVSELRKSKCLLQPNLGRRVLFKFWQEGERGAFSDFIILVTLC